MMNNIISSLPLFIILPLFSCFAAATIFTVPSLQYPTIADAAFVAVNDGDVIYVVVGVNGCGDSADGAVLRASVMIVGKEGMRPTVDCLGKGRAITAIDISSVKIENIRFVNGRSAVNGGAVYVGGNVDRVEIRDSEFLNSVASIDYNDGLYHFTSTSGGGGLVIFGRSNIEIVVVNNNFVSNFAPYGIGGGAAYIFLTSVSNVTVEDRSNRHFGGDAHRGGGVGAYFGNDVVNLRLAIGNEGAYFANNTSSGHFDGGGGGLSAFFETEVRNSTLNIGNSYSLFRFNSALFKGGAISVNLGSAMNVTASIACRNTTFFGNYASSGTSVYIGSEKWYSVDVLILDGIFSTPYDSEDFQMGVQFTFSTVVVFTGHTTSLSNQLLLVGDGIVKHSPSIQDGLRYSFKPQAASHVGIELSTTIVENSSLLVDGEFSSVVVKDQPFLYAILCVFSCFVLIIRLFFPRCVRSFREPQNLYQRIRLVTMCSGIFFSFALLFFFVLAPKSPVTIEKFFDRVLWASAGIILSPMAIGCFALRFLFNQKKKFIITDENMRLLMLSYCLLLLFLNSELRATRDLWIIPSMLAVISATWPPLGIRSSLWRQLQSDLKRDVLTIRKERLLVISGVLGQIIVIVCWMMPFAWTASSQNGNISRTAIYTTVTALFPMQTLLYVFATAHVYANIELYPVLQKRHQDRVNNDQRESIVTATHDEESTQTLNILKKSQLIAGVAAFSPLLGVASIAVCVAAAWIPMAANEQAAVITMGVIGIIRCLLQQIALMKKRGRRHRDIAANELSLSSFLRSMREMWRQSTSLDLKQRMKDMMKPITTFFGSWIGTQWMVFVNGLITSIPLIIVLAVHQISQGNSQDNNCTENEQSVQQMTGLLIGLGAASAVVAGSSLIGDAYPQYKIVPVDESFRLTSILKSLMLAVKGLVLATTAASSCGNRYQLLGQILLAQYVFTFAFSFFLTFVNVRTLWKMSSRLPMPNGRIFLLGYIWSFVITKVAAILLPFADKLGTFFLSYHSLSSSCEAKEYTTMSADRLQLVFTSLAIGLFFSITMNNETAHLLETCKKILNSLETEKISSDGTASISTLIPVACLGIVVSLVALLRVSPLEQKVVTGWQQVRICSYRPIRCPVYILCLSVSLAMLLGYVLLEIGLMQAPFWSRLSKSMRKKPKRIYSRPPPIQSRKHASPSTLEQVRIITPLAEDVEMSTVEIASMVGSPSQQTDDWSFAEEKEKEEMPEDDRTKCESAWEDFDVEEWKEQERELMKHAAWC